MPTGGPILVTGALGFVGRHLVQHLLQAGFQVTGLGKHGPQDRLPEVCGPFRRQLAAGGPGAVVRYAGEAGEFSYHDLDLTRPDAVGGLLLSLAPSRVFHLAAQSSPAVSFENPRLTLEVNLLGTLSLLEAMRGQPRNRRPVMLAVGSAEEYGPQPAVDVALTEDTVLAPVSPYGVSKAAQTLLCRQYARAYGLPVVVARSFNHTGPGQDARFAFPSFARQIAAAEAAAGPAVIKVGNLDVVRDFLDVRDVVRAYDDLIRQGRPGEVYHVCSGRPLTIRQGLEILCGLAARPIEIVPDPQRQRPADTPYLVGDNARLRDLTGWRPQWDITRTLSDILGEARKEFS